MFGSMLAKSIAEAEISQELVAGIARVTDAYEKVKGAGANPRELSTALIENWLKPSLEKTREKVRSLYKAVPEHSLFFPAGGEPPRIAGALEEVDYPVGAAIEGIDPLLRRVGKFIERKEEAFNNLQPGDDPLELSFKELEGLRKQLGDLQRAAGTTPSDRRLARELKKVLDTQ